MAGKRGNHEGSIFWDKTKERWCAEVTLPHGKRKKKRARTKKEVQDWLLEMRNKIISHALIPESEETVATYFTRYLEDVVAHTVKPSTIRSYTYLTNTHIIPEIGHIKIRELSPRQLQSLYSRKLEEGLSKRSVQYIHALIRKILNQAVKTGQIVRNPTSAVEAPRPDKKEPQTLTIAQAQKLFATVESPRWKTIYIIAVLIGLRKSEILGLRWEDVNFENSRLSIKHTIYEINGRIHHGTPKTKGSRRNVLMPDVVSTALQDYQTFIGDNKGLVFKTSSGRPVSPRNLSRAFHIALQNAGLPRIRFHDLRHTAATILLSQNVHPKVVQEMLGHSSITLTLETYSHVIQSIQKEAANKMDDLFK